MSARTSTFWIGVFTGLLLALIATELWSSAADSDLEQYREVRDFVRESFVRDVDDRELLDHALHGMLAGLDEYSRYYDPEEALALRRETVGRYQGIGCYFRPPTSDGQILFTYFHFASDRSLTEAMLNSGATCVAYETLRDAQGRLPLLTPMSEVAGRMSVQEGAKFLERPQMGRGVARRKRPSNSRKGLSPWFRCI